MRTASKATLIGSRIREARADARLSQAQLAAKIGAHVTSVSDWERGANAPSPRHLFSIAEVTGKPLDFFRDEPGGDRASGEAA